MTRSIPLVAVLLTAAVVVTIPAQAQPTHSRYQAVYERVDKQNAGPYAGGVAGRNLADDGVLTKHGTRPATASELRDGIAVMGRMLHPYVPPPVVAPEPAVAPAPASPVAPVTTSGGCPSYMAAEATSPDAVNPTSGAAGCFQILPSTQAAYQCPDVGPECAARICADVGASAWASSGADPCPYVQP